MTCKPMAWLAYDSFPRLGAHRYSAMDIYAAGVPEDAFEGSDMDMSSSDSEAEEVGGHIPS